MDKPNTLQEAIQIIESANIKINGLSAKCDASDSENLKLQKKNDELSKKDMDVETRASAKAAQILGESGIEKPVSVAPESEELSMEEISDNLSKADGREKALLMEKYGTKISAYLKGKK